MIIKWLKYIVWAVFGIVIFTRIWIAYHYHFLRLIILKK